MTPTDTPAAQAAAGGDLARALRLATLSLAFGRVERVTRHEDGRRPETDTDHTVMLGFVACELAPAHLDRAKVATYSLVHDLPEVHAGDTQTLVISPEAAAAKRDRETAARVRLVAELGAGSWVAETLATYEQQQEPEARFVRLIDKVLPKLTHAFNGCTAARALTDRAGFVDAHAKQLEKLRAEYPEFPEAHELLRASMVHSEGCWPTSTAALAPRSAGDLAAIEARAAEYERAGVADVAGEVGARERWGSAAHASAADVPALLAHIAAERERHAAELASHGDALGRSRESIAEACDAAVAEERARCAAVCRAVARGWPGDDVAAARMALSEAREFIDDGRSALDASRAYDAAAEGAPDV